MRVHILVLCDRLDELARTSGDLDAQRLDYSDFSVTYLVPELDAAASTRLDELVSKRPNLDRVQVDADAWSGGVRRVAEETNAGLVLVVKVGEGIYPEALDRLAGLAEQGHDVVVGRRVGQPVWGAADSRGPVAAVLASSSVAKTVTGSGAGSVAERSPVEGWLAGWHETLLDAASAVTVLEDYPVLAPEAGAATGSFTVQDASATWEGSSLLLEATLKPPATELGPTFVVRGPREIEYAVATEVQTTGDTARLIGRLDVTNAALGRPLDDGDWNLGVEATAPGGGAWSLLPRITVSPALVGGRPVVTTLRADNLQLQVGVVRRRYFRADPADARITESADGVELVLPVADLHVAQTEAVHGLLLLDGLKIPAVLTSNDRGTSLRAWLSGLAGSYAMSVKFGHKQPVPLGMKLVVDGVGAMTLVATGTRAPTTPEAEGAPSGGALTRIRRVVPEPVIARLRRVPALKRWYAERAG